MQYQSRAERKRDTLAEPGEFQQWQRNELSGLNDF